MWAGLQESKESKQACKQSSKQIRMEVSGGNQVLATYALKWVYVSMANSAISSWIKTVEIGKLVYSASIVRLGVWSFQINPIQGGGQKRLLASSSLNFDKNNHRMRL